jgi:hypothetical protein
MPIIFNLTLICAAVIIAIGYFALRKIVRQEKENQELKDMVKEHARVNQIIQNWRVKSDADIDRELLKHTTDD